MRRAMIVTVIAGLGVWLFLSSSNEFPARVNSTIENQPLQMASVSSLHQVTSSVMPLVNTGNTSSAPENRPAPEPFQLLPHEVPVWNEWAEARGYDLDGSIMRSYESMSDDVLLALANQNDPKAHFLLANRILAAKTGRNISYDELAKVEEHLYAASVLGYTSTLAMMSELKQRKAFLDLKSQKAMLAEAYKYAVVGVKRGDPGSDAWLRALKQSNPLSAEEEKAISVDADTLYSELSRQREAIGLSPFDNETPPEVWGVMKRIESELTEILSRNE